MRLVMCVMASLLVMGVPAAAQYDLASPKLRVEWAEFKKLYDAGKVVVVDVRDRESFEASRIPESINVPLEEVEHRVAELKKYGKPIVFYCA